MKLSAWIQSLPFVTQSAHFFAGCSIVLGLRLFFGLEAAIALLILWVVLKEGIYDAFQWGEGHGSPDLLDALFYLLGGGVAVGLLYFSGGS